MKNDIYDLFSEYTGELPEIKEEACDAERIKQLVSQKMKKPERIDEQYQSVGMKKRKAHFFRLKNSCEVSNEKTKNTASDRSEKEEFYNYEFKVKGVDLYMKKKWRKPVMAAAACLLIVGGVIGGTAIIRNGGGDSSESYYASVGTTAADDASELEKKEKTVITAAFITYFMDCDKMVDIFNSSQDDYTIKLVDYHQYDDDIPGGAYGAGAMRQLKIDIAAGDAPDIIVTSDHSLINMLSQKGEFADLYNLMATDPEVNKDTLLPNILKAFESSDGKLYSLAPTYQIDTMVVKKKFGQKENWSIDDMIAFFDSAPDTADHLYDSETRDWMLECIVCGMNELVDYDRTECHFDSDEFIKALEFCGRFAEKEFITDKAEADAYWRDVATWTVLDRTPFMLATLYGSPASAYSNYSGIKYLNFGGEDFTFVGTPSSTGDGGHIDILGEIAILDTCSDKNGAWKFVREFFTKERQAIPELVAKKDYNKANPIDAIPVRKDCFEDWIERQKYCVGFDDDGHTVKTDHSEYKSTVIYAPTDEELEDYRRYILSCDTLDNNIDPDILNICKEEAAAYFAGDSTAKQAAERIQSRCSILLSENS